MSVVYTARYRIRETECDAYGHLNNAHYARYMQEAAFEASAAVGYSKARYESINRAWVARETRLEYLLPLFAGDEITIKTWVADFRGVRSLRQYEFWRDDDLTARASTDWVFLVSETAAVVAVPDDIAVAYSGGEKLPRLPRPAFPTPPVAPVGAFTLRCRAEWRDIDAMQHVNNAAYLNYIEDSAIQAASHYGWPPSRTLAEGMAMVVRKHHIEYLQPALMNDALDITTWFFDVRRFAAMRHYTIQRASDGVLLAQAQSHWVAVNFETGKPVRVPAQFVVDLAPNMA